MDYVVKLEFVIRFSEALNVEWIVLIAIEAKNQMEKKQSKKRTRFKSTTAPVRSRDDCLFILEIGDGERAYLMADNGHAHYHLLRRDLGRRGRGQGPQGNESAESRSLIYDIELIKRIKLAQSDNFMTSEWN